MIRIELKEDEITAALASLSRALVNKTPVMQEIGEYMVASTQDRVARGETPEGTPFAPRAQTTLDIYARKNFSYGLPLNRSGVMRSGIFSDAAESEVTIGSNAIQAAVMQFGAAQGAFGAHIGKDKRGRDHFHSIPFGNIPARPFLGVSDDDRTNILDIINEWLARSVNGGA